ncbi:MAG: alpha/beta hydrolase [Trueperaceae bacterium]
MKYLLGILFILLVFTACSPLAYVNFQVSGQMNVASDIVYNTSTEQRLDIYTRPDIPSKGTVIFVHGGYWDSGNKNDYPFLADSLTEGGYTTVTVDYRLVSESVTFPNYVNDVANAVTWTFENIGEYGGNAERIFLMGHSAGAHIAALVAFDERYLEERGQRNKDLSGLIGFAGAYNFLPVDPNDTRSVAALGPIENYADTQPINFVDSTDPPAFLAYTLEDDLVNPNNTISFANAIRDIGEHVEEHEYDGVDHITLLGALARASRFFNEAILEDLINFLNASSSS